MTSLIVYIERFHDFFGTLFDSLSNGIKMWNKSLRNVINKLNHQTGRLLSTYQPNAEVLFEGLLQGNRAELARSITLIE